MENSSRKATDVILELESKINQILGMIANQEFNIKLISQKLNTLIEAAKNNSTQNNQLKPSIETTNVKSVSNTNTVHIEPPVHKLIEDSPNGFRRTSRPETYAGDNSYLNSAEIKLPQQIISPVKETVAQPKIETPTKQITENDFPEFDSSTKVVVQQKVIDKNGKSVFMADVLFYNDKDEVVSKTRTNGPGKWSTSLAPGSYRISIKKRDPITKEPVEVNQKIDIVGNESQIVLPVLIFKG